MKFKIGSKVVTTRRNGERVSGKVTAHKQGARGDFFAIAFTDQFDKAASIWTRPSQLAMAPRA